MTMREIVVNHLHRYWDLDRVWLKKHKSKHSCNSDINWATEYAKYLDTMSDEELLLRYRRSLRQR